MNKTSIALICFILIVALHSATIDLSTASYCSCDSYANQADCNAAPPCTWANNACGAINCTSYSTQATCNAVPYCAISNDLKTCAAQTKCSDYSYAAAATCTEIGCTAGTLNTTSSTYPCTDITVKKCTEITDATECTQANCVYDATATKVCDAPKCSAQTNATCTTLRGDSFSQLQICAFNSTCADAEMNLAAADCSVKTQGLYNYNKDNSACESCATGSGSYGYLVAAIGTLFLAF